MIDGGHHGFVQLEKVVISMRLKSGARQGKKPERGAFCNECSLHSSMDDNTLMKYIGRNHGPDTPAPSSS